MAPVPGMFDVFLNHTATAAILLLTFFIVAFSTIAFAGHFSAREVAPVEVEKELETEILHQQWSLNKTAPRERVVDSKKLVPEKKPNLETMAAVTAEFDVFLNHRGPDVKPNFVAHLHEALQEAGCRPFVDNKSLETGQHGQNKIFEALRGARVHVAIFSEHYAESKCCLKELCDMLESKKLIIPVFYHVSPDSLRCKPHGPYTEAFRKHHRRRSASEVEKWKEALRMAAELEGFKLDYNGDEAELKTKIVSKVRDYLRASEPPLVRPYQVGLEETSNKLIQTLNSMEKDVAILSLFGMGGIGKTTLAEKIYFSFEKNDTFEKKSKLMTVRERPILDLQKELAWDLFGEDVRSMEGFNKCFKHAMDRKVLILIDDIDEKGQFDKLIPDINKLCPGSRIIITSRDSNVVNNIVKVGNCKCLSHKMNLLSTIDSRRLFNWHAFHNVDATDGFQELAEKVADACCNLPLALKVIGCLLFDKREKCDLESTWPQTIKTLSEEKGILDQLQISYDGLSTEASKLMFLDIACFMIGQRENIAMQIFEACKSDYKGPASSFNSLKDKCLVQLDEDGRIVMHDCLRDMGRRVVMNQSHNMEKGTPSHLWDPEMVQQVLQNKEGTNKVRGLSTFGIGRGGIGATNVAENYIGMRRLHFLLLDGDNVKGNFSTWSRELRWIQWTNSDILKLPSQLDLPKLAVLDLTSNKELMQIWPNDLEGCEKFEELPMEFGKLQSLVELDLSHCSQLGCLPDSIVNLSQLKTFRLQGCAKFEELPMEFGKLQSLVELDLSHCSQLGCLPDSIVNLSQLKTFQLEGCEKLENLPMEFGKLESLVKLDLSYCQLGCLPYSIVDLSQLKTFRLDWCDKLETLPMEFRKFQSLVELDLSHCTQLGCLPDSIVNLSQLRTFRLHLCEKLENLPMEFGKLQSLVKLDLSYCSQLGCLPYSIVDLSQLKTFRLEWCNKLETLPMEFGKLQSLVKLDLSYCTQLGCLPDSIVNLSQLRTFRLHGCEKLENLPMEFGKLQSLVKLDLSGCSQLGCLPDSIVDLSQLKIIQ
ncbi:hypothetical protein BDL97_13G004500 [Sphagnum fallax]|nr:hypothetical protein BDL97_13G004500 [Sphagnum fallax]